MSGSGIKATKTGAIAKVGVVLLLVMLAWFAGMPKSGNYATIGFLLNLFGLALVLYGLGNAVTGRRFGFAYSDRGTYSLSRMQMAAWTVIVLAMLLTASEVNLFNVFGTGLPNHMVDGKPVPATGVLDIGIPGDLLVAMGIAAFSFVAAPAILEPKKDAPAPDAPALAAGTTERIPSLIDIVNSDTSATLDMSKVQQLLVTVLLIGAYLGTFIRLLHTQATIGEPIGDLPQLSAYFTALLAVSHAGYLGSKTMLPPK